MIRQTIKRAMSGPGASSKSDSSYAEKEALLDVDAGNANAKMKRKPEEDVTLQLLFCAVGIYTAYLIYGSLQEDIFTYSSPTAGKAYPKFKFIWLVQVIEALINSIISFIGFRITTRTRCPPKRNLKPFLLSGFSQVLSKAFTSLSLASGLSYPIATLAKSGKMAPVMMGQYFLGKSRYTLRDYVQVAMIIAGTATLGLSKSRDQQGLPHSSKLGVTYILLSLVMDGIIGGLQKKIKCDTIENSSPVKGFEFMMYTNMVMFLVASFVSICCGDLVHGIFYCLDDPYICNLICKFCVCSAVGQTFIFHTIAIFDPLVCSTITTTRKIVSVFISIVYKGHIVNAQGWCGLALACFGIACELHGRHQSEILKSDKTSIEMEEAIIVSFQKKDSSQ
jgi:UDP-galactose transporter B1